MKLLTSKKNEAQSSEGSFLGYIARSIVCRHQPICAVLYPSYSFIAQCTIIVTKKKCM